MAWLLFCFLVVVTFTAKWDRDLVPETVNDEGILTPAEVHEVMMDELAGTVWRNVYMKREDLPEEHYADLAQ